MPRVSSGGLVHHVGGCRNCPKQWSTRNVLGVAAQHTDRTGHETWVETGHSYEFRMVPDVAASGGAVGTSEGGEG